MDMWTETVSPVEVVDDPSTVKEMVVNVGPSHPSTHGVCRVIAHLDGEVVTKADFVIGYLHRGIEKIAENRTYQQVIPLTDRLDYVGSMYANWAYCRAVEKLAGITVPERAEYIRIITCELQRIASHMMAIGSSGNDAGATTLFVYAFWVREYVVDLFARLCGSRLTYNYLRPGGVSADIPDDAWVDDLRAFCKNAPEQLKQLDRLFFGNVIAKNRTKGIGVLSAEEGINGSVTGPSLRASGVDFDLRRDEPYSLYDRLSFDVVVGENGDSFERARCRLLECYQSLRIIEQALDQIEPGRIRAEGVSRLIAPAPGEAYERIESARGTLGVFLASDGGPRPWRMKVRSPAFSNLSAVARLAVGHTFSDLVVILGSFDPVFGEVDR
jgi:NADH-quinone oxidoreductase subunit D